MSCMPDMTPTRTGKIIRNDVCVFERGENLLQIGTFKLNRSSEIMLQS